jgi:hypothetical protein
MQAHLSFLEYDLAMQAADIRIVETYIARRFASNGHRRSVDGKRCHDLFGIPGTEKQKSP